MKDTIALIDAHVVRGACTCGRCADAPENPEEKQPTGHTVNVHFFEVALSDPDADKVAIKAALKAALEREYPDQERLWKGPSYMELGGAIGDQGYALMLIGLGGLVGLWSVITPEGMGFEGAEAKEMAGRGFVMLAPTTATVVASHSAGG